MSETVTPTPANHEQILDSVLSGNKAAPTNIEVPNIIGKPIYEKDLEYAKFAGFKGLPQLFGRKVNDDRQDGDRPLNFGSKAEAGFMPDDVRLRLFNLKKMISNMELQAGFMFKSGVLTPSMLMETPVYKYQLAPVLKAYNITDFSNWIPTVNARFYFEEFEIPFLLADLFDQMPMDSATVEVPGDLGHLEGVEETDVATFGVQSTTQANYSVSSRNNVCHTKITEDLLADASPAYMEKLRRDLMKSLARSYEKCILNGDTAGSPRGASHQDADTQALALNATFSKAFDGVRKKALAAEASFANKFVYNHGGDSASKVMFEQLAKLAGKMFSEKGDLAWLVSPVVETQVVTGAIPELFTAYAFGGVASNVTGSCPPIFGVPVVVSQYQREDLADTGVYVAPGSTLTTVALIKKSRYANFVRQAARMWAAPSLPSSDEMLMTIKMRHAWAGNPMSLAEKSIVMARNVATI